MRRYPSKWDAHGALTQTMQQYNKNYTEKKQYKSEKKKGSNSEKLSYFHQVSLERTFKGCKRGRVFYMFW